MRGASARDTVAAGLVRRTQFDADRCEARLAGKDDFEPTQQRAAASQRYGTAITEGLFMASRDRGEISAAAVSFGYFFLLLGGLALLRPVRDAMGVGGGPEVLPWKRQILMSLQPVTLLR